MFTHRQRRKVKFQMWSTIMQLAVTKRRKVSWLGVPFFLPHVPYLWTPTCFSSSYSGYQALGRPLPSRGSKRGKTK
ncbi:uncharacterized protein LACBIDRAFT_309549 [Laccaria bicolor S238N-H82]|uniref:Predicted protein n=1 Tax=Laccaria bicolor (strain S238N-H82 / ATCC MYA-4686) TaxID=486041 RepID=B0DSK2_LACBS|nr:uncharacterized protein LACBIDRAFT_309549 [Laccaria bicolor S238N-H82]EDR02486.1 predicted protein [Laccaria bicolor S238N-H82]|eukprot:XP_001886849.1 predicted protein [Laccaria bicolor S238N-H82]